MERNRDEEPAVLITATDSASGLACVRSLGSYGVRTIVASEIETAAAFSSRYCTEAVIVPSPREELLAYRDALLSIAERPTVRTIVPTREEDAYVFARYRDAFEPHVATLWPSFETLASVHDRLRLAAAAADAGVPVPETQLLDDVDNWDRNRVVKSRYSILTDAYCDSIAPTVCDRSQTVAYIPRGVEPDRERLVSDMRGAEPIVQEFVPSNDEYSFAALYDEGTPVTTYQKRHVRGKTYAGGPSVYRESIFLPELEEYGRALLDHLNWHGIAEVQFLRNANTGNFELLEVNPLVWGSIPCAIRAGADFPRHYWSLATGNRNRITPGYEVGVSTHFLYGELGYLVSVLRDDYPLVDRPQFRSAVRNLITSTITSPHFDHLSADDPKPFIRAVFNALGSH